MYSIRRVRKKRRKIGEKFIEKEKSYQSASGKIRTDSVYSLSACDGFAVYSELPGCQMGMFPCYSGYKQWTFLQSFTDYIYGRQHSWLISVVVYSPCIEVRSSFDPYCSIFQKTWYTVLESRRYHYMLLPNFFPLIQANPSFHTTH